MAKKKVNKGKGKVSTKGIVFITNIVARKKRAYPNRKLARAKAGELLKIFRDRKELITIKGINKYLKTTTPTRKPKEGAKVPYVVPTMFEVKPFYDLQQYPQMISDCETNVTFVSDIFDYSVPTLKGGDYAEYVIYFKGYVDYCNEFVGQDVEEYSSSDWAAENMCVTTLPPEQDANGRWIAKIIVCNGDGTPIQDMYGFAPDGDSDFDKGESEVIPVEKGSAKKKREKKRKESKESKGDSAEVLKLKLELKKVEAAAKKSEAEAKKSEAEALKSKAEIVKTYADLFKQGLITKKDFERYIKG